MDQPATVVLMDNDPAFALLASAAARQAKAELHVVRTRRDALQMVYRGCELAIISKDHDSGLDVFSMLREVRPEVPIILTSEDSDEELQRQMYAINADLYLPKPVSPQWLVDAVRSLIAYSRRRQAYAVPAHGVPANVAANF